MRRRRTIYFNDARHYYLWVFEPPLDLQDAWRPVDEVAGTAVDTFIYGVERGDGLFYPSKVGLTFGDDKRPFRATYEWRAWQSMRSLVERGLDPLTVLIDRAHDKGMEFFASLRMSGYGGMDEAHMVQAPDSWDEEKRQLLSSSLRADYSHRDVRDHQLAVLEELTTEYPVDGIELDFGFAPFYFGPDEGKKSLATMTGYVRKIADMVRARPGGRGTLGARVLPTEEMCLTAGLDVRAWLTEGLVDFVAPVLYQSMLLDPDLPIDWLVQAAHDSEVSVYPLLQPWVRDETTESPARRYPTPDIMRATAANFWDYGADGLYTWFLHWPLEDAERRTLAELGDPELIKERDKRYVLRRRGEAAAELGYDAAIPLEIPSADPSRRYAIPFYIADDIQGASDRVRRIRLWVSFANLASGDRLTVLLNGQSLADETCLRDFGRDAGPAALYSLEFHLRRVRPHRGRNVLEVSLDGRPDELIGGVTVQDVEITVEYGPYPSSMRVSGKE